MADTNLPLLNIYEIEEDGKTRHLVGFLDPVLAGAIGIDSRAMVGEFEPTDGGEFDPDSFEPNPEFIDAFTDYMNDAPSRSPGVVENARSVPGQALFLVDPRDETGPEDEPPVADVMGQYLVDDAGQILPGSFRYNPDHLWFNPETGVSGVFADRAFYDWLHPIDQAPVDGAVENPRGD